MPNFQHKHTVLNYHIFGHGSVPVIAFHGFSRSANDYALYEEYINKKYKVYAVDLFYHGKSKIDGRKIRSFSKEELRNLFEDFIEHLGLDKFQVLGYSMGGRLALFLTEQFPEQVEHLYLLAPDGLKTNFWNWWVTNTKTGKNLYGFTIHHPQWVSLVTSAGQKLKILPEKMDKFVNLNFATKGMRLRIYRVWKLYQHIHFRQETLVEIINNFDIKVDILVGKKDPVVTPKLCESFHKKIGQQSTFHLISAGHDLFKPHALQYIGEKVL